MTGAANQGFGGVDQGAAAPAMGSFGGGGQFMASSSQPFVANQQSMQPAAVPSWLQQPAAAPVSEPQWQASPAPAQVPSWLQPNAGAAQNAFGTNMAGMMPQQPMQNTGSWMMQQ